MPTTAANNPLYSNALLGYGYDAGQRQGALGQQAPAQGQRAGALAPSPAMQAFGGRSDFAQGAIGAPAAGGAGGLSPDVMQSLQGLVTALTQVVQQLATLLQTMGGGQ